MPAYRSALLTPPQPSRQASTVLLRQREEWIRFSYCNEDTKDQEEERAGLSTDD
jgi:hypothetical protein